jgi:hypothetical protein
MTIALQLPMGVPLSLTASGAGCSAVHQVNLPAVHEVTIGKRESRPNFCEFGGARSGGGQTAQLRMNIIALPELAGQAL